jgi:hypothetical protein
VSAGVEPKGLCAGPARWCGCRRAVRPKNKHRKKSKRNGVQRGLFFGCGLACRREACALAAGQRACPALVGVRRLVAHNVLRTAAGPVSRTRRLPNVRKSTEMLKCTEQTRHYVNVRSTPNLKRVCMQKSCLSGLAGSALLCAASQVLVASRSHVVLTITTFCIGQTVRNGATKTSRTPNRDHIFCFTVVRI